ncbi:hypothetical protein BCT96_005015 [Vibrio splendidus]|uniref:hypothetical protein n=1 Tax=Vibrio splendidus TaxID=29497 RepID=UPI000C84EC95|nr:hypothetical protein [Vibrio splendidus]PMI83817.1 hypothetical protein BCU37_13545 [Vibrio splendidus]PMK55337.1 hypothetical protein BCT96_21220 [Vibrio splendidus]
MGFITNIKKTIRGDSEEVQQFHQEQQEQRVIPKRTYQTRFDDGCDGYYNKGNWWDDSDDIDHREYVEDAFDQYAREFHSAETDEERYAIFNQDRSWMMN